ncbi:hypothetical protein BJV77DRAFT_729215 [Russula vinacea]|nr:hypothetical protein BJV77DRAFT_729215 [Russula vinacea]
MMVNFRDPAVVVADSCEYGLQLSLEVESTLIGSFRKLRSRGLARREWLFIWEILTTLNYEWSIIQGRRRYRWTIWVYSLSRVAALMAVIATLALLNLRTPYDCQLFANLAIFPSYVALATASFLLVLRVAAIWNRNLVAVVIATVVWTVDAPLCK